MDLFFQNMNNNKIFSGCLMLLMNIGGRYIAIDIPKTTDNLFKHKILRYSVVFSICFIATHDIKISILLTLLFILIFKFLLDNKSKSCILPSRYIDDEINQNDADLTSLSNKPITTTHLKYATDIFKKYRFQRMKNNSFI